MPQIVNCPDCGRNLSVPDHLLGRNVKCPGCGRKFLAEDADDRSRSGRGGAFAPRHDDPPPRDYDDRPRPPRRRDDEEYDDRDHPERRRDAPEPSRGEVRQGWERVRTGVHLVIIGMWVGVGGAAALLGGYLMLLLFGAVSMASIVSGFSPNTPPTQAQANAAMNQAAGTACAVGLGLVLIWGLVILVFLAFEALRITGYGFCMGIAPTRKTQMLKGLAIAVFCLGLANLLLPTASCGGTYLMLRAEGGCLWFGGWGLGGLLVLAEFICFLLFLRGVALALRKDGLAQNLLVYTIVTPIYSLLVFALPVIVAFGVFGAFFGAAAASTGPGAPNVASRAADAGAALFIGGVTCTGVVFLIGLGLTIWFMMMLHQVRGVIDRRLDRN